MAWSIKTLRIVALAEALSFLVLLLIAMPLKYLAHQPEAVSIVGMGHGMLFLLLLICIAIAWAAGLPSRLAVKALLASIIPTGPFWIDHELKSAQTTPDPKQPPTPDP